MTTFQKCEQLKIERRTATPERQEQIDTMIKRLEPFLSQADAVSIVHQYESGLRRGSVKVDGVPLWEIEPWEKQADGMAVLAAGEEIRLYMDSDTHETLLGHL